jgi:hypothetical protein
MLEYLDSLALRSVAPQLTDAKLRPLVRDVFPGVTIVYAEEEYGCWYYNVRIAILDPTRHVDPGLCARAMKEGDEVAAMNRYRDTEVGSLCRDQDEDTLYVYVEKGLQLSYWLETLAL